MIATASDAANTAIFQRQLPFRKAVYFVSDQAKVDTKAAEKAVKETLMWYKKH